MSTLDLYVLQEKMLLSVVIYTTVKHCTVNIYCKFAGGRKPEDGGGSRLVTPEVVGRGRKLQDSLCCLIKLLQLTPKVALLIPALQASLEHNSFAFVPARRRSHAQEIGFSADKIAGKGVGERERGHEHKSRLPVSSDSVSLGRRCLQLSLAQPPQPPQPPSSPPPRFSFP